MSLTLDENRATYQIRAYEPGCIKVNEQSYNCSIIIAPEKLIDTWPPQKISELTSAHLAPILAVHPSIFILGTGATLQFPKTAIYGDLINAGIGVEVMDTRAACRTYNLLTAENRDVIAALIIA